MTEENAKKLDELARAVLKLGRNTLVIHLRFMDTAISRLSWVSAAQLPAVFGPWQPDGCPLMTEGTCIAYSPAGVCRMYSAEKQRPARAYLHLILHCVFRHFLVSPAVDQQLWNLACDMAVEGVINGLNMPSLDTAAVPQQQEKLEQMSQRVNGLLTAEKIYHALQDITPSQKELDSLAELFKQDDHSLWYQPEAAATVAAAAARQIKSEGEQGSGSPQGQPGNQSQQGQQNRSGSQSGQPGNQSDGTGSGQPQNASGNQQGHGHTAGQGTAPGLQMPQGSNERGNTPDSGTKVPAKAEEARSRSQAGLGSGAEGENRKRARERLEQDWRDISERMQMDMETFSRQQGDAAGDMMQNLRAVNREKYDYGVFLKKFAVMGEAMKINQDEFDYVFYTYGMKLFPKKRMPLIEPLEYKDVRRVREFVIAIDTSGSVQGEQVQRFLQKTYNILKNTDSFFSRINLHIIQCDAAIQEHVKITTQEEFDHYLAGMSIKGCGGTDFRPVFACVDELVRQKEFTNLKGLIYFTDGYGDFPSYMPAYKTAFVFVQDSYDTPQVPVWAMRLILQPEDLNENAHL